MAGTFIADLHIHSKYSRATSKDCVPEQLDLWARRKGLDLIGTGDFTHPAWREELRQKLAPDGAGLYVLREEYRLREDGAPGGARPRFLVTGEISSIYKKGGRVRKVHNLILLPGLEEAEALSRRLETVGNLHSDGRPILGLDSRDLLEIVLECCPAAVFIPAHIWTPHFSLFGAYSGFDTIEECFGDLTPHIHALETGLSSDPPMNWRLSALDSYALVSNSDAHSPQKLAREANLFGCQMSYPAIARALCAPGDPGLLGTLEFFPEEGKYHYDGHRACHACLKPADTLLAGGLCPVCGKKVTVGVLHRVEDLADRAEGFTPPGARPFESLVPLPEVIAAATGLPAAGVKVRRQYEELLRRLGPEMYILRQAPLEEVRRDGGALVAEGLLRLRQGRVQASPGYDGEYGKIGLLNSQERERLSGQLCLFGEAPAPAPAKKARRARQRPAASPAAAKAAAAPDAAVPYGLSAEQWAAASAPQGVVAVVAGPGTGKTHTLVRRIAWLVECQGARPEEITAVTFTNLAAAELGERLGAHFGDGGVAGRMQIGTFHALCLRLLEGWGQPCTVIDACEAASIVGELTKGLRPRLSPGRVLEAISRVKNGALPLEEAPFPPALYDMYEAALARYGVLDFDDLLLRVLGRFEDTPSLTPADRAPLTHLLVDEFQDVSPLQYALVRAWARGGKSLFVIGDPDQAIYGFRGADSRCFARLAQEAPEARRVSLRQNYRSTPQILRCAAPIPGGPGAARELLATRPAGAQVRLLSAKDAFSEALFVVKEIGRMVGGMDMLETDASPQGREEGRQRGFNDIAVLYRTHRQAAVLEECLQKEGIPYLVAGRDDFLRRPPVRRALAFFRLLQNPGDAVSLRVCLRAAGLGEAALGELPPAQAPGERDFGALLALLRALPGPGTAIGTGLAGELERMEPLVACQKPAPLLESWAAGCGLSEDEGIRRLHDMAVLYESMPAFLNNLVLGRERDVVRSGVRTYVPDAVSLMTLHGAKGLQFPVVFLCGASEGVIPLRLPGRPADEAEERRLLYVGMTRAREELVLLAAGEPSPFLADIPEDSLCKGSTFVGRAQAGRQLSLF